MTKQYQELFKEFVNATTDEQLTKIREARSNRNIERPAAARRRVVKEERKKQTTMGSLRGMLSKLTPEQREELRKAMKKGS